MRTYFPDDKRILELIKPALAGDERAVQALRIIYERGEFDPGFGRDLSAFLETR